MKIWIDIEDSAGVKLGDGPIVTAQAWEDTARLSRAGIFRFTMPAGDPRAALCQAKRRARCYARIDGAVTEVGAGIIDKTRILVDNQGQARLEVSGDDLLRELTYTQVGQLAIDDGAGGPDTSGPADIIALSPAGWSLDVVNGYNVTLKSIMHTFEGESTLAAFCKLAEITGERFRLGSGKKLIWMQNDQADSGLRAVQGGDPVSLESNTTVCLIQSLDEEQDSYDAYVGRVYAYGVGSGEARVTLDGAATGYAGYLIGNDTKGFYLQHTATWIAYGIERYQSFKDVDNAGTLAELAYEWIRRQLTPARSYRLSVAKLDAALAVGSTMRVIYKRMVDGYLALDVDDDLVVLEATRRMDAAGLRTVRLLAATIDRWPQSDALATVAGLGISADFYTHPQPVETASFADRVTRQVNFTVEGVLAVESDPLRVYNRTGLALTISQVHLAVGTAPTGAAIIVDVHKNGTTIFTNQAHRPQVAAAATSGQTTTIDVPAWADGEYLTIDVDQVGSTVAGSDLTVTVVCS